MATFDNPFQFTRPVEPNEIIDRVGETGELQGLAESGNNTLLVGPRRYGKTSLLGRLQRDLDLAGWVVVYVDLLGIASEGDLAGRIEAAYQRYLKGRAARWFTTFRRQLHSSFTVGGGPMPASGSLALRDPSPHQVEELLDLPRTVAERTGQRVHVVYDEFQEVLRLDDQADSRMRSVIQHHGDAVSYLFAGSDLGMMEELFSSKVRSRAFYAQAAPVHLAPLSPVDLSDYVGERFDRTGRDLQSEALGPYLALVDGHPQRAMLVAHHLWEESRPVADLKAWDRTYDTVMESVEAELAQLWSTFSRAEGRAARAAALGTPPYGARSGSGGGGVKAALEQLRGRGVLTRGSRSWAMVDPLLGEWLRARRPTDWGGD